MRPGHEPREAAVQANAFPSRAALFLAAVGEQVLTYRETAGLSVARLAEKAGLSAHELDQFEHGWLDLPLTTLQAIADGLGTTVAVLLDVGGSELGLSL
jgi:transcriptional regulator with XRE-family HTH domain